METSDLSPVEALYGLYYLALVQIGKVINLTKGEVSNFLVENAGRNRQAGRPELQVMSMYGVYIGVDLDPAKPLDASSYDSRYGEGKAEEALNFARKLKAQS